MGMHYLRRHRKISTVISISLLLSFLLLFFVSLSTSVIKGLYFLGIRGTSDNYKHGPQTNLAIRVTLGMWGYCTLSELGETICSAPRLGFNLSDAFLKEIGPAGVLQAGLKALSAIIVMHVVCCALTLIAFLLSISIDIHASAVCACIICIIDAILTTLICAVDVAIAAIATSKSPTLSRGLIVGDFGPAVILTILATVLQWIAVVLLCMVICSCLHLGGGRAKVMKENERHELPANGVSPEKEGAPVKSAFEN
ncbi:hypothetical protein BD410DRAFT_793758 [Rickenella mellea]|uniref:Pali-domain-containing protein n=1 Tax=Rickenella mellea TaxID=50990 RepID=A0A4Y7PRK7_9AGAM|nr:hypothetical protein BD410DRAFT_793758 [Rickenella mellea]